MGFIAILLTVCHLQATAQCVNLEPGFEFLTSSSGCAPFTVRIQTKYFGSTPGTIYFVNWGDGTAEEMTTQTGPSGVVLEHTYPNIPVDCGYDVTIDAQNACNPRLDVTDVMTQVIVWANDIVDINPVTFRVCQGYATSITFEDNSDWNCFPRDTRENVKSRWVQWIYGTGNAANRIPGILVDGAMPGTFPYLDPAPAMNPKYPVNAPGEVSLPIAVPATLPSDLGKTFEITLNNWNQCNPYPGNTPETTTANIVIVGAPTPDFVTRKINASGPLSTVFCIDDDVYFDNESTGEAGSTLRYSWTFFDGPNATDPILNTSNSANPTMVYTTGGKKLVRLVARDNAAFGSCAVTTEKIIDVFPTSIAQIDASGTRFCKTPNSSETFPVTFTDASIGTTVNTRWRWEFYDEAGALVRKEPASGWSLTNMSHTQTYTNPGVYKVKLFTKDDAVDCYTEDEVNIVVYNKPTPDFVFQNVCEGAPTDLSDASSVLPIAGSKIDSWQWDTNYDGSNFSADLSFSGSIPALVQHTFAPGSHQVALRTTLDQGGCTATTVKTVMVEALPKAIFSKNIVSGCSPLQIEFDNMGHSTQPAPMARYEWIVQGPGLQDTLELNPDDAGYSTQWQYTFHNPATIARKFGVLLKSTSKQGCITTSAPDSVEVKPSLAPDFTALNYDPFNFNCSPLNIRFQVEPATRNLAPNSYTWKVLRADTVIYQTSRPGSDPFFEHNFLAQGNKINSYKVALSADVPNACMSDTTRRVHVNPTPSASFTIDTLSFNCEKMVISLEASPKGQALYDWTLTTGNQVGDFDDPTLVYEIDRPAPGSPAVPVEARLKVANYALCPSAEIVQSIAVPAAPDISAQFTINPDVQEYPATRVNIQNLSKHGGATSHWDFGDGEISNSAQPLSHSYPAPGTYWMTLRVAAGTCVEYDSARVIILPTRPVPDFEAHPTSGCAPHTVHFENKTTPGELSTYNYRWYFGDNQGSSNAVHPSYTYYEPGVYSVKLEAFSNDSLSAVAVKQALIEVYPRPVAAFDFRPKVVKLPNDPIFTTNLSYGAIDYEWHFGDGGISYDFEPQHNYLDTGLYDITLIAITDRQCTDTARVPQAITVKMGERVRIPNAFTPSLDGPSGGYVNGNGRNDVFFPVTEGVVAYHMQILNRWGQLLYESEDMNRGWDGYFNGKVCPQDVYIYRLQLKYINGREETKIGDVTLIR